MRLSLLLSILPMVLAAPATKRSEPAPLLVPRGNHQLIADKYIVKFKQGSALSVLEDALSSFGGKPDHMYDSVFKGFALHLNERMLKTLRDHPDVRHFVVLLSALALMMGLGRLCRAGCHGHALRF